MSNLRQRLLRLLPFLGSMHRFLHWGLEKMNRAKRTLTASLDNFRFNHVWEARIRRHANRHTGQAVTPPVIHLYATSWNSDRIVPYFINYYSRFVSEFHIYDNQSSDTTCKILARYPNVEVTSFDTGGTMNEEALMNIRNNAWKSSRGRADFVIVCDMDEFLYHAAMPSFLALLKQNRFTIVKPHGYDMISNILPPFDGKQDIMQRIKTGIDSRKNYSKTILFSPELEEINFSPGCHKSSPVGRVKFFTSDHLKLLHYKYVDRAMMIERTVAYQTRQSEINLQKGWGRHYHKTSEQISSLFDHFLAEAKDVI